MQIPRLPEPHGRYVLCGSCTHHERTLDYREVAQDIHLAVNQADKFRCGDNGIFKGVPVTEEQMKLSDIARTIFAKYPSDGKYILDGKRLIICQSNAHTAALEELYPDAVINPLGDWTGGTDVDTGATNRKLGSDMADSVTGSLLLIISLWQTRMALLRIAGHCRIC